MSVQAITWAYEVELPPATRGVSQATMRFVLVTLANYADRDGRAWPSLRSLTGEMCMGESAIRRAVYRMQDAGLIRIQARRRPNGSRTSNVYCLVITTGISDRWSVPQPPVSETPPDPSLSSEPSTTELPLGSVEKVGKTRPRDPAFDELAELHGGASGLSKQMAKTVGVALAGIKRATPNVGADEIRRRAEGYRRLPWNRERMFPSAQSLAKWWADCDRPEESSRPAPSPGLDESWLDQAGDG